MFVFGVILVHIFPHKIIFQNSPLRVIEVGQIRQLLLGDGAYPSTDWLLKPFPNNIHLIETQKQINKALSGGRVIVERAFGLLKGRWRYLLKRLYNENPQDRPRAYIRRKLFFGGHIFGWANIRVGLKAGWIFRQNQNKTLFLAS